MKLYRIFYSDGNDVDELGRVSANNIDEATEYAVKQYFTPDLEYEEDSGDEDQLYLRINSCKYCDKEEIAEINDIPLAEIESICEFCETSEYIEIRLDEDAEPSFKTIFGRNEYANLETGEKPYDYNPLLAKAWGIDPQLGVTELMHQTINDNPKLVSGIDLEYLKKINQTHKDLIKGG